MKRKIKSLLILTSVFLTSVNVYGVEINSSDWARPVVEAAANNGYVPEDLLEKANNIITRKEFAELTVQFYEAVTNAQHEPTINNPFTDIDINYVLSAVELGFFTGVSETKFDPNGAVTREQMAVVMTNVFNKLNVSLQPVSSSDGQFSDTEKISSWALDEVNVLKKNGILIGDENNNFSPKGITTTEQVLTVLMQYENMEKESLPSISETIEPEVQEPVITETEEPEVQEPVIAEADEPEEDNNTEFNSTEKPSRTDETLTIGSSKILLGEDTEAIIDELGTPQEEYISIYGTTRYIYSNDYENFVIIGFENNKVVEIYSNAKNMLYKGITGSTTFETIDLSIFDEYSTEKVKKIASNYNLTIYFDVQETPNVDAIYLQTKDFPLLSDSYSGEYNDSSETALFHIINSLRVKHNLEPLERNETIDEIAQDHANELAEYLKVEHKNSKGLEAFDRMDAAGLIYDAATENICGYIEGDEFEIYSWWTSHIATYSNLLIPNLTDIGIGIGSNDFTKEYFATIDILEVK